MLVGSHTGLCEARQKWLCQQEYLGRQVKIRQRREPIRWWPEAESDLVVLGILFTFTGICPLLSNGNCGHQTHKSPLRTARQLGGKVAGMACQSANICHCLLIQGFGKAQEDHEAPLTVDGDGLTRDTHGCRMVPMREGPSRTSLFSAWLLGSSATSHAELCV